MTAKTAPKVTLWEFFQQLGKTFMLPVALLSFCGICWLCRLCGNESRGKLLVDQ